MLKHESLRLSGVEAGGRSGKLGDHAARFSGGALGVLHGTRSMVLQDEFGQIAETHSFAAGLDYPGVGPQHAQLQFSGRATYVGVTDEDAVAAFRELTPREGISPAPESSHPLAYAPTLKAALPTRHLPGRGANRAEDAELVRALRD